MARAAPTVLRSSSQGTSHTAAGEKLQARLRRVVGIAGQLLELPAGDADDSPLSLKLQSSNNPSSSRPSRPCSSGGTPRTAPTSMRPGTESTGLQAALRKHSLPQTQTSSFSAVPDLEKALDRLQDTLQQLPASANSPRSDRGQRGKGRQQLSAAEAALSSAMEQLNASLSSPAPRLHSSKLSARHRSSSDPSLRRPLVSRSPSRLAPPRSWQPIFTSPQPPSSPSSNRSTVRQSSQTTERPPEPVLRWAQSTGTSEVLATVTPERKELHHRSPWALSGSFVEKHCSGRDSASTISAARTRMPDLSSRTPESSALDQSWRGRPWSATQTESVVEANSTLATQVGGELAALAALAAEARAIHPECAPLADALRAAVAEELALLRTSAACSSPELSIGVRLAELTAFVRTARDSLEESLKPVALPSAMATPSCDSCAPSPSADMALSMQQDEEEPSATEDWASLFALRFDHEAHTTPPTRAAPAERAAVLFTPPRELKLASHRVALLQEEPSRFMQTPQRHSKSALESPASHEAKAMAKIFGSVADDMRSTIAEIRAARKDNVAAVRAMSKDRGTVGAVDKPPP